MRFSLLSGLLLSVSPATQVLGSLKAWPSLALSIGVVLVARWAFPWVLSDVYPPLEGVARGNVWARRLTASLSLALVWRATGSPPELPRGGVRVKVVAPALAATAVFRGARVHGLLERSWPACGCARTALRSAAACACAAPCGCTATAPRASASAIAAASSRASRATRWGAAHAWPSGWGRAARLNVGDRVGLSNSTIVCLRSVSIEDDVFMGGDSKVYDTDFHSRRPETSAAAPATPGPARPP